MLKPLKPNMIQIMETRIFRGLSSILCYLSDESGSKTQLDTSRNEGLCWIPSDGTWLRLLRDKARHPAIGGNFGSNRQ